MQFRTGFVILPWSSVYHRSHSGYELHFWLWGGWNRILWFI